jgi:hydroxymethylpyrimidine pyrophosphatase-like HAD family hydrolase
MLFYINKIISFDFDNTLTQLSSLFPKQKVINALRYYCNIGYEIIIISARDPEEEPIIKNFCKEYDIPVSKFYFTSNNLKGSLLRKLGVEVHFDDDDNQIESARLYGVKVIDSKNF